jgi:hypothetical protein
MKKDLKGKSRGVIALSRHFPGRSGENQEKPQSG